VEYFVSYYDYYQPEAYLPTSDTYIEKDSSINDEIDRLRHATTSSLLLRRDVIVVASVSCIYGLGSPDEYRRPDPGAEARRRSTSDPCSGGWSSCTTTATTPSWPGPFRVRGDTIELHPAYEQQAVRIELFGDTVERIRQFDALTGEIWARTSRSWWSSPPPTTWPATRRCGGPSESIEVELRERLAELQSAENKLLEAQRLRMRTEHDLEMLAEVGVVQRHRELQPPPRRPQGGRAAHTLLDFFPKDFLTVIDESHVAVPQIHGQYAGDRSRKETLVEHGFRLPSALDNRPLTFDEFSERVGQVIFLSATPGAYEIGISTQVAEQVIRPTGLVDPEVVIVPTTGQIDDLLERIKATAGGDGGSSSPP
jgi:excinuclease ABC subunit B